MKRIKFSLNNLKKFNSNLKNRNNLIKLSRTKSEMNNIYNIKSKVYNSKKSNFYNNNDLFLKKKNKIINIKEICNNKSKFKKEEKNNKNKIIYDQFKKSKKNKQFSIYILPLIYQFKKNMGKVIKKDNKKINKKTQMTLDDYKKNKKEEKIKEFTDNFITNYKYILNYFKNELEKRDDYLIKIINSYTYNKEEIYLFFFSEKNMIKTITKEKLKKFITNNNFKNIRKEIIYDLKKIETKFKEKILKLKNKKFNKSFLHLKKTLKNVENNKNLNKNYYGYLNNDIIKNTFLINDNNNIKRKLNYLSKTPKPQNPKTPKPQNKIF